MTEKKTILTGLYYEHDLLVLSCFRDGCWLENGEIHRWQSDTADFAEVKTADSNHQWDHVGRSFGAIMELLRGASSKPTESLDENMEGM